MVEKSYKYKFSFVMPVYNVEDYLAETIESILAQTMDFEENVELILVNDGSPDNSDEVCVRYQQQYPDNIKYIKQKNQGVCAARNNGIKLAQGKYITFLDSDDILSRGTLKEVYDFFEDHFDEIDFVSIKLVYFEARTGDHPLNYKYETSRVVRIEDEIDAIQMSSASAFIKSTLLQGKNKFQFDGRVAFSEDSKLMTEILLEKMAYGVVSNAVYYYRKRLNNNSAINSSLAKIGWYFNTPELVYKYVFNYSIKKLGYIPRNIQYMVMYDLQWRYRQYHQNILSAKEIVRYENMLVDLLQSIDDDIILSQQYINSDVKLYILSQKYGEDVMQKSSRKHFAFSYENQVVYDYAEKESPVVVELIEVAGDFMTIYGYTNALLFKDVSLEFRAGKNMYKVDRMQASYRYVLFLDKVIFERNTFKVTLPLADAREVSPYLVAGADRVQMPLVTRKRARLNQDIGRSYRVEGKYIIIKRPRSFDIEPYTLGNHIRRELKYMAALLQSGKAYSLLIRILYYILKPFYGRPIWLISDRINAAGDNGEALFKYSVKQEGDLNIYYAVSKESKDFKRMKKYGKVVNRTGFYYKLLFLFSDKIISSHADDFVVNAFGAKEHNLSDLYKFDFVFLQHGIIHNDLSGWLNKLDKNIKLFITSAKPEYESVKSGDYGYTEKEVKLTGLPRYDYLKNNPKNKLILAPTWRHNLVGKVDALGKRIYNEQFKKSEYYQYYNNLMNDSRVTSALKSNGMKGELYLHPALDTQVKDFSSNEVFSVKDMPYDYRTAFSEGNIMVTDYSSVAFDFAFLKKPVVYAQYDTDSFYVEHMHKPGYFSYKKNGFGPVATEYEDAVSEIVKLINNKADTEPIYKKRVEKFFYLLDSNNSKRVHDAILNLDSDK